MSDFYISSKPTKQLYELESILIRKWCFWETDCEPELKIEQENINEKCTRTMKAIDELLTLDLNKMSDEYILYFARFYLSESSLAPWASIESKKISIKWINRYIENDNNKEKIENLLIHKLETILIEIKRNGLSNNINSSGYNKKSKFQIGGKLIGSSYTKIIDKMDEFKIHNITYLGYLNILILKFDIEKNWRIILPLLLTFLDDTDLLVKRESVILLDNITKNIIKTKDKELTNNIILKSQTMPLFKDAIFPLLLALPSLTPEDKSVCILLISYTTIFNIFKISIKDKIEYYNIMSALLNDTILPSINKCKDYINVLNELLNILRDFLNRCKEFQIVLTKQIVYTLLTVLMDPYIAYSGNELISNIVSIIQHSLENVPIERRIKYKYDVLGCIGTLKRRLVKTNNYNSEFETTQLDSLIKCVDI